MGSDPIGVPRLAAGIAPAVGGASTGVTAFLAWAASPVRASNEPQRLVSIEPWLDDGGAAPANGRPAGDDAGSAPPRPVR